MYLAFDTETSGIHADAQVLTAYFIILDSNFNEIDSLDLKIKYPVYSIQLKAFQVNNIDLIKHEQEALISLDAKIKLKNFLLKHKKNKYIPLGHNVKFDLDKMKSFGIYDHVSSTFNLDTMQIAQFLKSSNKLPFNQSLSLKNLTEYYGLKPTGELHNAECDIRLTIELFKHIQKVLTQQSNQSTSVTTQSNIQSTIQDNSLEIETAHILLNMKSKKNSRSLRKRKLVKYF
jgi:inhibitor of KinA sporulation pathway (predicted exonuclease)